jgi:hypothetical protein
MFRNFIRRGRRKVFSRFYLDWLGEPGATVFLAGSGRSGTTWMSDIINHRNEFRYIFEPLLPTEVSIFSCFHSRQYLRPDNNDPRFLNPITALLRGKLRNQWADHFNRRFASHRRLIKDIRAGLLLKWLATHFPEVSIVFMLRHPCAAVNSQLRTYWSPPVVDADWEQVVSQEDLVDDFLREIISDLRTLSSPFEKLIALWCIENVVVLKQFTPRGIHIVFYEHLCERPYEEAQRLFSYLKLKPDYVRLRQRLSSPSDVASTESAIIKGGNLTTSWMDRVSSAEIVRALEILTLFGLEKIYNASPQPLVTQPQQALAIFPS